MIVWKDVVNYEGEYQVSNTGFVRSLKRKKLHILKAKSNTHGRLKVELSRGRGKTYMVHQLVAEAFLGPKPKKLVVRHLDGNYLNNNIENLAYGTQKQNLADAIAHGTHVSCKRKAFTDDQVSIIRSRADSVKALSKRFGVSRYTIYDCINRRTYQNIH